MMIITHHKEQPNDINLLLNILFIAHCLQSAIKRLTKLTVATVLLLQTLLASFQVAVLDSVHSCQEKKVFQRMQKRFKREHPNLSLPDT